MSRISLMNVDIDNLTFQEALDRMCLLIDEGGYHYVVTPNVDHLIRLQTDEDLRDAYQGADLVLTDGKPLLWFAQWFGTPIKQKISGSDLFPELCRISAEKGYTMCFFGAAEGVAAQAARNLTRRFPRLNVVGTISPCYGFEKDSELVEKYIAEINDLDPDILVVALGCPKQEVFISRYRDKLSTRLALGLGASVDFEAGNICRAPKWMSKHGLEWLFRILQDPKRLAKRYLVDDIRIFWLALKYRLKMGR